MADKLKFLMALALVSAGVTGFYVLADKAMILRVLSVLAGLGAGAAVAWFTEPGRRFYDFSQEAVVETKKVVWPARKETMQTTGIVFAFVLAMAIILWLTDKALEFALYDLILGWKK